MKSEASELARQHKFDLRCKSIYNLLDSSIRRVIQICTVEDNEVKKDGKMEKGFYKSSRIFFMAFGILEYSELLLPRLEGRVWGHFSLS